MLDFGTLGFSAPWALAALLALPALWWLLRAIPPSPQRIAFPPLRLLAGLVAREQTAVHTPPWLLALRLLLAAALILGLAHPVLNASGPLPGSGPVVLVVDDGWGSGQAWALRQKAMLDVVEQAEGEGRAIVVVPTAPSVDPAALAGLRPLAAARAREAVQSLHPNPWPTQRAAAIEALQRIARDGRWPPVAIVWFADGLEEPSGQPDFAALLTRLAATGVVTTVLPPALDLPVLLKPASDAGAAIGVTAVRPLAGRAETVTLNLVGDDRSALAQQPVDFAADARRATVRIELPAELAQRLARVEVAGQHTAGGVLLFDARWQRRAVGLISPAGEGEQTLLDSNYYLERAMQPFAEVRTGSITQLLARPLSMLVMTDIGALDPANAEAVRAWVERGGVLLRFAGPRLVREASRDDPLLPVALRAGVRTIGGAMSWKGGSALAPFEVSSPLAGLSIPADLQIRSQVIAEPSLDVAERTWARLEDGTPLVTGARRGQGWVVLVHTAASPDWGNLPLTGLFVDLLRRVVELAHGSPGAGGADVLPPLQTLDGFGRLGKPNPGAQAIAGSEFAKTVVGPRTPPGFYGTPAAMRALNLSSTTRDPLAIGALPASIRTATLGERAARDLRPWLLALAMVLAAADLAASLAMRGLLRAALPVGRARSVGAALLLVGLAALVPAAGARAESVVADGTAIPAALATHLAYIRTGDAEADRISAAGLTALTDVINRRTATELAPPVGVDPAHDDVLFYPLLYWPLGSGTPQLSPAAVGRLVDYMRTGGTIVFDTQNRRGSDRGDLRELARTLDLPALEPMGEDHVLLRSYYLLPDGPGRWAAGPVWVEPSGEHVNDGVSSVIVGSADWAGAWAVDASKRPIYPVVPGGERQRELAYRFGVNLVMYVLTGNYKADQVHVQTIIERLGR